MNAATRKNEIIETNPNAEADALDKLLADLDTPTGSTVNPEEVIEEVVAESSHPGTLEIESAAPGVTEVVEPSQPEVVETEAAPKGKTTGKPKGDGKKAADKKLAQTTEEKAAAKAAADADKEKKKKEAKDAADAAKAKRKADREAKAEQRKKEAAEKPAPTPRKHYANKVDRISDKLGDKLGDFTVLTLSDAALTGDALAAKQQETLEIVKKAGVKVQNRMTLLLEFVAGKQSKLNEVIARAFTLLHAEGKLTVGEKGNFHQNLLAKPYSVAAARAMGNNTLAAMRDFKVIAKNGEGHYVANPESLILMKVNGLLGLTATKK